MTVNNRIKLLSVFAIFFFFNQSCNSKLNDLEYVEYLSNESNGLKKVLELGEWVYDIQYKPSRLIIIKEQGNSKEELSTRKKQLERTVWFNISIKHNKDEINPLKYKVSSIEEYNQRLDYFLNDASKEITLEYKNLKLKPISYLFENNYSLTPNETMIVGFELPTDKTPQDQMTLIYNDLIFKNGIVKVNFKKKDIARANNL
jgi:hypothetical protein